MKKKDSAEDFDVPSSPSVDPINKMFLQQGHNGQVVHWPLNTVEDEELLSFNDDEEEEEEADGEANSNKLLSHCVSNSRFDVKVKQFGQ